MGQFIAKRFYLGAAEEVCNFPSILTDKFFANRKTLEITCKGFISPIDLTVVITVQQPICRVCRILLDNPETTTQYWKSCNESQATEKLMGEKHAPFAGKWG